MGVLASNPRALPGYHGAHGSDQGRARRVRSRTLVRLGTQTATLGTATYPAMGDAPISAQGQIPLLAGVTRTHQVRYRKAAAYCTIATFNLTNGIEVL